MTTEALTPAGAIAGLEQVLASCGYPTRLLEADPANALGAGLLAEIPVRSVALPSAVVHVSFLPDFAVQGGRYLHLLTNIEIAGAVTNVTETLRIMSSINSYLPLGFFGILESEGSAYLKHAQLLDPDSTLEAAVSLIDHELQSQITILGDFADTVLAVALDGMSADRAWQENKWHDVVER